MQDSAHLYESRFLHFLAAKFIFWKEDGREICLSLILGPQPATELLGDGTIVLNLVTCTEHESNIIS